MNDDRFDILEKTGFSVYYKLLESLENEGNVLAGITKRVFPNVTYYDKFPDEVDNDTKDN
jgi:hypothetical protein